jgi:hypothetical protein
MTSRSTIWLGDITQGCSGSTRWCSTACPRPCISPGAASASRHGPCTRGFPEATKDKGENQEAGTSPPKAALLSRYQLDTPTPSPAKHYWDPCDSGA